jgi:hypothetical protein
MTLAEKFVQETSNRKVFTVTFVKRTNGELRRLNGLRGVTKGVKGVGHSFNPTEKGLLCVYDLKKSDFRFVNLSEIVSFKANKKSFSK